MRVELDRVGCRYGARTVLADVSASIHPGQVTVLLGPNGSGKSTLLRAISGIGRYQGRILFDDVDTAGWSLSRRAGRVGYVAQDTAQGPALSVFEATLLGRVHSLRWSVHEKHLEAVWGALHAVGIEPLANEPVATLSGGQRQLAAIAQALVRDPQILLFDEPISSLDLAYQLETLELIADLTRERGICTLVSLHHLDLAGRYADQLLVLHRGGLHVAGAPAAVLTEDLVREVFQVQARIVSEADSLHVNALSSLRRVTRTHTHS
ncbi:ABC transporter ATP-binding protein [Nocardioides sp.]|uniref:ABC transporter ATP-binding protein n=1 Tax=Nocardioides sp. TaxID=35761 RepID=UPI0039E33D21